MKFVSKNKMELSDTSISDLFILNYMNSLQGIDIKLYLYILFVLKNKMELEISEFAKQLGVTEAEISNSLDVLQAEELITKTSQGFIVVDLKDVEVNKSYIPKMEPKVNRVQSELERKRMAAASAINESFFQGIMSLGWYTDIGTLFKNYSFSEEVMIALFHYCRERKALNRKYVYAVAENWYRGGVKTFEQLEEFLESYDNIQKIKQKIQKALRLNRNFTKYEEQYIDTWIKEYKYEFNIIEEALKRTVAKSNPSLKYVDAILSSWHKKGYKTLEDIKKEGQGIGTESSKESSSKAKPKYQNYEQREYDDIESFYDNV
ncbi:MAG: DnaD domain protein [Clostridia bacterium]|nr:DnaD domain protein [Clostridia bacterium]